MKKIFLMCAAVCAWESVLAAAAAKLELAVTAELAPFSMLTKKVSALGATINNPIVPTVLIGTVQQQFVKSYGRFRNDAPSWWLGYVQPAADESAASNKRKTDTTSIVEHVLLYPAVQKIQTLLVNHPGATKDADNVVHLLPGEGRPHDQYVAYTADSRYCAFASSSALARQAIADFAGVRAAYGSSAETPLLRVTLNKRGIVAASDMLQKKIDLNVHIKGSPNKNMKDFSMQDMENLRRHAQILSTFTEMKLTLDLSEAGVDVASKLKAGPTTPKLVCAGAALPAGALTGVPESSPLFGGGLYAVQTGFRTRKETSEASLKAIRTLFASLRGADNLPVGKAFLDQVEAALTNLAHTPLPEPVATDWNATWLAYDAAEKPYLENVGVFESADVFMPAFETFLDSVSVAVLKEWPDAAVFRKGAARGVYTFDWNRLITLCGTEKGKPEPTEAAAAKKNLVKILGASESELTLSRADRNVSVTFGPKGFKRPRPAAAGRDGEARVAAALPEIKVSRPSYVFLLTPYAFARERILPMMAAIEKDKDEAAQIRAMIAGLTPASANSALAGALWAEKDGSFRSLLRLTTNELKNLGAAFNAFTAASMSSALKAGEDDE